MKGHKTTLTLALILVLLGIANICHAAAATVATDTGNGQNLLFTATGDTYAPTVAPRKCGGYIINTTGGATNVIIKNGSAYSGTTIRRHYIAGSAGTTTTLNVDVPFLIGREGISVWSNATGTSLTLEMTVNP